MQVNTYMPSKQTQTSSMRMQEGEVYRARILERSDSKQAVLGLRGGKIKASFEGAMPRQNQVAFQVTGNKEGVLQVRALQQNAGTRTGSSLDISGILKNLGIQRPSNAMTSAAKTMLQAGSPLTKDTAASVQRFIEQSTGTQEQKQNTIRAASAKGVKINNTNLQHIHEGLHRKSSIDFINDLTKPGTSVSNKENTDITAAVKNALKTSGSAEDGVKEIADDIRRKLQNGGSLEKAVTSVKKQLLNHPDLPKEEAARIEKAVKEAEHLTNTGKERLEKALQTVHSKSTGPTGSPGGLEKTFQELHQQLKNGKPVEEVIQKAREVLSEASVDKTVKQAAEQQLDKVEQQLQNGSGKEARRQLEQLLSPPSSNKQSAAGDLLNQIQRIQEKLGSSSAAHQEIKQLLQENGIHGKEAERILKLVSQLQQLDEAGKQQLMNSLDRTLSSRTGETGGPQGTFLQNALSKVWNSLQEDPDMENVMQKMKTDLSGFLPETIQKQVSGQMAEAEELLRNGKEMASRQAVDQILQDMRQAGQTGESVQNRQSFMNPGASYALNETQQTVPPFEAKQMLETKITDRMVRVTDDFKQLRQNTVKQLDQAAKMVEQERQSAPQAKQVLEAAIKKLDRSILRSDFMLFTDMKTERKMLQASSQLAEAKNMLSKGQNQAALKIIKDVQQSVEAMEFKASEQKVKHVITREESMAIDKSRQGALQQAADQSRAVTQEPSSRQLFELVRSLGLNRETEIAQNLASGGKEQQGQTGSQQQNMKEALLHLLKREEGGSTLQQKTSQSLANVTGQQLMSKSDQGNNVQQLLFNLPVPLKDKLEQLQVYVQSRQEEGQLDWENCHLYFLIETPSLGETGIMVQAADRQLSVTLKNDEPDFKETMEPLVEQTTESISDLGYNIYDIQYQPMTPPAEEGQEEVMEKEEEKPADLFLPFYTEKGFDYKI
ncbi:hypothetical protein [Salibacterium aidingense]|uniref:hypothetical protein n=1 Tax=Salibacterium aidingense TaxID=384933 RepID=UPI0004274AF4|nr:hypothetical protein [Salibacterium aidingense]